MLEKQKLFKDEPEFSAWLNDHLEKLTPLVK